MRFETGDRNDCKADENPNIIKKYTFYRFTSILTPIILKKKIEILRIYFEQTLES